MKFANEYFNGVDLNLIKPNVIVDKFVNEIGLRNFDHVMNEIVWDDFVKFCGDVPPISKLSFHKALTSNYPLTSKATSIDGQKCRVIVLTE